MFLTLVFCQNLRFQTCWTLSGLGLRPVRHRLRTCCRPLSPTVCPPFPLRGPLPPRRASETEVVDSGVRSPESCESRLVIALRYASLGFKPIPLLAGTKVSAVGWKRFQVERPVERELERWFSHG